MGLERTTAVVQGVRYVYEHGPLRADLREDAARAAASRWGSPRRPDRALHILADHARGIAFLIADGVRPGNQRPRVRLAGA